MSITLKYKLYIAGIIFLMIALSVFAYKSLTSDCCELPEIAIEVKTIDEKKSSDVVVAIDKDLVVVVNKKSLAKAVKKMEKNPPVIPDHFVEKLCHLELTNRYQMSDNLTIKKVVKIVSIEAFALSSDEMWCSASFNISKYNTLDKNNLISGIRESGAFKLKSRLVYDVIPAKVNYPPLKGQACKSLS